MSRKHITKRRGPTRGTGVVWPQGVQERYGINITTRWRWEHEGRLPPRDVFVGGKAIGWKPSTLDAADAGAPFAGRKVEATLAKSEPGP